MPEEGVQHRKIVLEKFPQVVQEYQSTWGFDALYLEGAMA